MEKETYHVPVLLEESVALLDIKPAGSYADLTFGGGGHSRHILSLLGNEGRLYGFDQDSDTLANAPDDDRFHYVASNFRFLRGALRWRGVEAVDGILADLGVSSHHFDELERGFSFRGSAPLDMRMDMGTFRHAGREAWMESARTVVNMADVNTLRQIIESYGEDPQAARIARAIVDARQEKPIETTGQLADIVWHAYPAKWRAQARNHPATRTFQAIRMVVNDELGQLERFLDAILPRLAVGGRLAIITFHSLEDRIVKNTFRTMADPCICPKNMPVCVCGKKPEIKIITKRRIQK